ncbi:hypothetical protein PQR57_41295 [Paraburkholderia dipogonis]|uniref:Uncharacterized protein n=1 Tax=Paraburkholderia dipogonis TaxID=1211383 RepID=A0ABW9B3G6_9BURK
MVRAINACHQENVRAREDPAVRLIVHQLAFLCGVFEVDNTLDVYGKLNDECREKDVAIKAARAGAEETTLNAGEDRRFRKNSPKEINDFEL